MKKIVLLLFLIPTLGFSQGTFDVVYTTTDSMVYDTPGAFMSIHTTIHNLSSTDTVELNILKQFVDIPAAWETAICTDICYPASIGSVNLSIAPADSQEFVFYFYTDLVADSGYAKILYTNLNVPSNTVSHGYHGITQSPVGFSEINETAFNVYPNPANDLITVKSKIILSDRSYLITDALGKIVQAGKLMQEQSVISVQDLPKGFYLFNLEGSTVRIIKQ